MSSPDSQKPLPSLKRIKSRAKQAAKNRGISLSEAQDAEAKLYGFKTLAELQRYLKNDVPPADSPQTQGHTIQLAAPQPIFSKMIAGCLWSLELGDSAPELWLRRPDGRPPVRATQLGIFPVLVAPGCFSAEVDCWVLARYGTQFPVRLPELKDQDVRTLSETFGVFIARDQRSLRQSGHAAELLFLESSAFASLRLKLRQGSVSMPDAKRWAYGLGNVWNILVGAGDELFQRAGLARYLMDSSKILGWPWCRELANFFERNHPAKPGTSPAFEAELASRIEVLLSAKVPVSLKRSMGSHWLNF